MKGIKSMKIYEILDEENRISIGVLLYYEKEKTFVIELKDDLDEWTAPLLLASYVKKKTYMLMMKLIVSFKTFSKIVKQ